MSELQCDVISYVIAVFFYDRTHWSVLYMAVLSSAV